MLDIKNQYENIKNKRSTILEEIKLLEEQDIIKKYLELNNKKNELLLQQEKLYFELKYNEYSSCNHMWVTVRYEHDTFEGRSESHYGCIKCGLNQDNLRKGLFFGRELLSLDEQIMFDYMQTHGYRKGIFINELCNLELACAIYKRIKEVYPNIDDKIAKKYFEISLNDIRNIKVNVSRQVNRAKRLSLNSNFNSWTSRSVRF